MLAKDVIPDDDVCHVWIVAIEASPPTDSAIVVDRVVDECYPLDWAYKYPGLAPVTDFETIALIVVDDVVIDSDVSDETAVLRSQRNPSPTIVEDIWLWATG